MTEKERILKLLRDGIITIEESIDMLDRLNSQNNVEEKPVEKKEQSKANKSEKKPESVGEAEMKFSIDLATEFSNTINQFTSVCAKIVEARIVNKETADKFYDLYGKIKCLADAASKTE